MIPGGTHLIKVGAFLEIPDGYFGMVCSRSGMALKYGIFVANAPGIIDSDYRGEVGVILHNSSDAPFVVSVGERCAQLIIQKNVDVIWANNKLSETGRGSGGFGSTGK